MLNDEFEMDYLFNNAEREHDEHVDYLFLELLLQSNLSTSYRAATTTKVTTSVSSMPVLFIYLLAWGK